MSSNIQAYLCSAPAARFVSCLPRRRRHACSIVLMDRVRFYAVLYHEGFAFGQGSHARLHTHLVVQFHEKNKNSGRSGWSKRGWKNKNIFFYGSEFIAPFLRPFVTVPVCCPPTTPIRNISCQYAPTGQRYFVLTYRGGTYKTNKRVSLGAKSRRSILMLKNHAF